MDFKTYSTDHHQFVSFELPPILKNLTSLVKGPVLDVGCGDGSLLVSLRKIGPNLDLTGFDLSHDRLQKIKDRNLNIKTIQGNACELGGVTSKFYDLVISEQVIEHVPSDEQMLSQLNRVTKDGGHLFISSVVKAPLAWWIYKYDNRIVCDPTHVREYRSKKEFENLVEKSGFKVVSSRLKPFMPSLFNFFIRALVNLKVVDYQTTDKWIRTNPRLFGFFRKFFRIWAPGYFIVETYAHKVSQQPA